MVALIQVWLWPIWQNWVVKKLRRFSVGFEEDQFNELPMSRLVANKFGLESHEIIVRPDVLEVLPLLATQF